MRGKDERSEGLFSYVGLEQRIPADHPLRTIRTLVDTALLDMSRAFKKLYSRDGRPSIPPERLLRALLLQAFYTVRSERQLMEQLEYNLLFRWFVGLAMDDAVWDATVFSKNRDRLLKGDIACKFMTGVLNLPEVRGLLSNEHFSVDGTLIEAWACKEAKLCHMGHLLMENRNGLIVDARLTEANGTAERSTALEMIADNVGAKSTVGADKNYDTADFVAGCRKLGSTPHVAQNDNNRRSAIDGRTTRHRGYALSMSTRKRIEEPFGWLKTVAGMRKTRHRGRRLVEWFFVLTAAAYNLIRLPKLVAAATG
jgi:transposase